MKRLSLKLLRRKQEDLTFDRILNWLTKITKLCQKILEGLLAVLAKRDLYDKNFLEAYSQKIRSPVYFREIGSMEFKKLEAEHDGISQLLKLEIELESDLLLLAYIEAELVGSPKKIGRLDEWRNYIRSQLSGNSAHQGAILTEIDNEIELLLGEDGVINKVRNATAMILSSEKETRIIESKLKELTESGKVIEWLESGRIKNWEIKSKMEMIALNGHFSDEDRLFRDELMPQLTAQINCLSKISKSIISLLWILRLQSRGKPTMRTNFVGNLTEEERQQLSESARKRLKESESAKQISLSRQAPLTMKEAASPLVQKYTDIRELREEMQELLKKYPLERNLESWIKLSDEILSSIKFALDIVGSGNFLVQDSIKEQARYKYELLNFEQYKTLWHNLMEGQSFNEFLTRLLRQVEEDEEEIVSTIDKVRTFNERRKLLLFGYTAAITAAPGFLMRGALKSLQKPQKAEEFKVIVIDVKPKGTTDPGKGVPINTTITVPFVIRGGEPEFEVVVNLIDPQNKVHPEEFKYKIKEHEYDSDFRFQFPEQGPYTIEIIVKDRTGKEAKATVHVYVK
ncbi:hypothetical protein HYV80_06220 [Candidatus Woesearchaeota archaeon]|nr:hypothetical protein [Candidatus Woesearchaeota archaeon]